MFSFIIIMGEVYLWIGHFSIMFIPSAGNAVFSGSTKFKLLKYIAFIITWPISVWKFIND